MNGKLVNTFCSFRIPDYSFLVLHDHANNNEICVICEFDIYLFEAIIVIFHNLLPWQVGFEVVVEFQICRTQGQNSVQICWHILPLTKEQMDRQI